MGWRHAPAALPPSKTRYPLYRRLDGPGPVWTGVGNLALTGIRSSDRQPVAAAAAAVVVVVIVQNKADVFNANFH